MDWKKSINFIVAFLNAVVLILMFYSLIMPGWSKSTLSDGTKIRSGLYSYYLSDESGNRISKNVNYGYYYANLFYVCGVDNCDKFALVNKCTIVLKVFAIIFLVFLTVLVLVLVCRSFVKWPFVIINCAAFSCILVAILVYRFGVFSLIPRGFKPKLDMCFFFAIVSCLYFAFCIVFGYLQ